MSKNKFECEVENVFEICFLHFWTDTIQIKILNDASTMSTMSFLS